MNAIVNMAPFGCSSAEQMRQDVVDRLHRAFTSLDGGIKMFPIFLRESIEKRVWAEPRELSMNKVPAISFHDFIHEPYPVGIGGDYETVRRFVAGDERAMAAFDKQIRQGPGNKTGHNQHTAKDELGNVDNIHVSNPTRPSGTSAQAGLRRLDKLAATNPAAAEALEDVKTGRLSVHKACIDLGLRRPPSPLTTVRNAWAKATAEEREEIAAWIDEQMSPLARSKFR